MRVKPHSNDGIEHPFIRINHPIMNHSPASPIFQPLPIAALRSVLRTATNMSLKHQGYSRFVCQLTGIVYWIPAMKRGQHDVACACYVCHMKLWNCVLHSITFSDLNKMHRLSIFCFLSENITEFRCWCQTQVFIHRNQEREACCRMKVTVRVMYFDRTQYPLSTRENGRRASELINIIRTGKTAHKPSAPVFFLLHTRSRRLK